MSIPSGIPIALIPAIMQQQKIMTQPYPIQTMQPKQVSEIYCTPQTNKENGTKGKDGKNGKSPFIGTNGNWYVYNDDSGSYYDTGISATGGGCSVSKTYISLDKGEIYSEGETIGLYSSLDVFGRACSSVDKTSFVLDKGNYTLQLFIAGHSGNVVVGLFGSDLPVYQFTGKNEVYSEISFVVPSDGMVFYLQNADGNPLLIDEDTNSEYNFVVTKWS